MQTTLLGSSLAPSIANAIAGGVLIGLAATWLYLSIGRIAGISGIAARAIKETSKGIGWPVLFVLGLGIGGWLAALATGGIPATADGAMQLPNHVNELGNRWPWLVAGGLLVGFGTRMGSGCTSGHGVCGIARFSMRSLTATCVFVGTGMVVATLIAGLR